MIFDRTLKVQRLLQAAMAPKTQFGKRAEAVRELRQVFKPKRDLDLLEKAFYLPGTTLATKELIIEVLAGIGGDSGFYALMRLIANISIDDRLRFLAFRAAQAMQPKLNAVEAPHVIETFRPSRENLLREVRPEEVYDPDDPRHACSATCCTDEPYLRTLHLLADAMLGQTP